ncbi:hypothetical protein BX286_0745 [Streptomyces sp. 3211.6]|uniref:hypothetical protein n=1 Tax=Streptomyces sp. 3211.6 TaxID=1938845 RepID=UPI000EB462F5|nr:hypothetical protein [Streptomyces sp. 3211.6]RKT02834.1 hypothetical protein BX286_0745 [Streptomyces sp. 3211.6]
MTPGHWLRAARAAMFAAVCVLLAAAGHLLMSDRPVPWWAPAAAFAGTAAGAWGLAGRERGPLAVTSAALAVQGALHGGFSLAQRVAASATAAAGAHTAGAARGMPAMQMQMPSMPMPSASMPAMSMPAMPGGGHPMAHLSPADPSAVGMLAGHLLAAVLCALWLAYAERGVFRVLRALAARLRTPLRVLFGPFTPAPHHPPVHVLRARREHPPRRLLLVRSLTSRGPPKGTAVS